MKKKGRLGRAVEMGLRKISDEVTARWLRDVVVIAAVGAAALLPFLGQSHDVSSHEIRHAEIAREMAESGDFLIPTLLGEPYRDKPPVVAAAGALLFRWHGRPSLAAARLPSAIAAIIGAVSLYGIGRLVAERRAALGAALGLLGVAGYADMARTARPDMVFAASLLVACFASLRALAGAARAGTGFAIAGAACAVASLLKGPLAWGFCLLFPLVAPLRAEGFRRPRRGDGVAFVLGFVAALSVWVVPVVLRDRGAYLMFFLTQPDLTTWPASETIRRIHWPWMYGLAGFLPFTLLLPFAIADARQLGPRFAVSIAAAMLLILSVIPKKRIHYQLPVYPFLALAVAEAIVRRADRVWVTRTAAALVALSLGGQPLYFGVLLPRLRPGEARELAAARDLLRAMDRGTRIVAVGEIAEAIAFVGRRADVTEVNPPEDPLAVLERNPGAWLVLPATSASPRLREIAVVRSDHRTWAVYRLTAPTI